MAKGNERRRIREIISVFLKYGIKEGLDGITNPVQIRKALEELGPTFVKLGQILSTRPDMVPENYIEEFRKLQDNVKPEAFEVIKETIEKQLGGTIKEKFMVFYDTPIASASLAQVHAARLKSGEKVVVKVQRPRVKEIMTSDLKILKRLTLFLKLTPPGQAIQSDEMIKELSEALLCELEFLNEAKNIEKFAEYNKDVKYITCPKVYKEYTTSTLLVMEHIDGIKISDIDKLNSQGFDLKDISEKLAKNYLKQIFEDGFFHADPHPGNIFVVQNGIAYIDFGMMGTMSKSVQSKFQNLLFGMATRDIDLMTRSILKIGVTKGEINKKKLYSDIEQIYNNYIDETLYDIDVPGLLNEIFAACKKNNISMPREIAMFIKGLMTIEGVILKLVPDINIMDIIVPYIKSQMIKKINIKQEIKDQIESVYSSSKAGLKIPSKILELTNSMLAGKIKVQMEHTNLENTVGVLNRMFNRLIIAIITASLIVGSSLVINADAGPKLFDISALGFVGYVGTAVLGLWLVVSIIKSGKM